MSTVREIQAAAEALPLEQQEALYRALGARLYPDAHEPHHARAVQRNGDVLLEAPPEAPPMTPEYVKRLLEDMT